MVRKEDGMGQQPEVVNWWYTLFVPAPTGSFVSRVPLNLNL